MMWFSSAFLPEGRQPLVFAPLLESASCFALRRLHTDPTMAPKQAARRIVGKRSPATKTTPRKAGLAVLEARCSKLQDRWTDLTEATEEASNDFDVALIVQELHRMPEKIRGCKIAVMGTAFLRRSGEEDQMISESYKTLAKIGKTTIEPWFAKLHVKLGSDAQKLLYKADRSIWSKILYRAGLCDKNSAILSHKLSEFKQIMEARFKECGDHLNKLKWDDKGRVNWATWGVYVFAPSRPKDHPKESEWVYSELTFNGQYTITLGNDLRITDSWAVERKWLVKGAVVQNVAAKGGAQIRIMLKDLFSNHEGVQQILKGCKLGGDEEDEEEGENDDKAMQETDGAVACAKAATPTKPQESRSGLTDKQLKVVQMLKKLR